MDLKPEVKAILLIDILELRNIKSARSNLFFIIKVTGVVLYTFFTTDSSRAYPTFSCFTISGMLISLFSASILVIVVENSDANFWSGSKLYILSITDSFCEYLLILLLKLTRLFIFKINSSDLMGISSLYTISFSNLKCLLKIILLNISCQNSTSYAEVLSNSNDFKSNWTSGFYS